MTMTMIDDILISINASDDDGDTLKRTKAHKNTHHPIGRHCNTYLLPGDGLPDPTACAGAACCKTIVEVVGTWSCGTGQAYCETLFCIVFAYV